MFTGTNSSFASPFTANTVNSASQPQQSSPFGATFNQPTNQFGASFSSPTATASIFGKPANTSSSLFGVGQTSSGLFSPPSTNQSAAGTSIPFKQILGTDTLVTNGRSSQINTRHECITVMPEYGNKSFEELRLEDYQLNRKGPVHRSSYFGASQPQPAVQQSTSIFSSITNTTPTNTFGTSITPFGNQTGGLTSNFNQPKPATSFLSQNSTSPFGGAGAFQFNNPPTSQPSSIFNSNNNNSNTFATVGTSPFNLNSQQPAFGGNAFGQQQNSIPTTVSTGFGSTTMAQTGGIFGSTTTSPFAGGTQNQLGSGGLFGSTASQQPQQQKPLFSASPFTGSMFGATTAAAAPSFNFSTATSNPNLGFGQMPAPAFGANNNISFGNTAPNFSFSNPTSNNSLFGTTQTFSSGTGVSSFNQNNSFTQSYSQIPTTNSTIPTTPFKETPFFYHLMSNRNLSELTKPTSPMAQQALKEASKRRIMSKSYDSASVSTLAKSFILPLANKSLQYQPQLKHRPIFDGFDDGLENSVDILSPKSSVKKLSLKTIKAGEKRHCFSDFTTNSQSSISDPIFHSSSPREDSQNNSDNSVDENGVHSTVSDPINVVFKRAENLSSEPDLPHVDGHRRYGIRNECDISPVRDERGRNSPVRSCNIISTRPGYYTYPNIEELDRNMDEHNSCWVSGFVVGRDNFGEIRFMEPVNVVGINLDEIVLFHHKEVVVYADEENKPPIGEGLNCPAEITLERVWPIEKITKEPIKSPSKIKEMNYENKLRRACTRLDAEFLSYDEGTGKWKFRVKHFSKYNCNVEESEEWMTNLSNKKNPYEQLGFPGAD